MKPLTVEECVYWLGVILAVGWRPYSSKPVVLRDIAGCRQAERWAVARAREFLPDLEWAREPLVVAWLYRQARFAIRRESHA